MERVYKQPENYLDRISAFREHPCFVGHLKAWVKPGAARDYNDFGVHCEE